LPERDDGSSLSFERKRSVEVRASLIQFVGIHRTRRARCRVTMPRKETSGRIGSLSEEEVLVPSVTFFRMFSSLSLSLSLCVCVCLPRSTETPVFGFYVIVLLLLLLVAGVTEYPAAEHSEDATHDLHSPRNQQAGLRGRECCIGAAAFPRSTRSLPWVPSFQTSQSQLPQACLQDTTAT